MGAAGRKRRSLVGTPPEDLPAAGRCPDARGYGADGGLPCLCAACDRASIGRRWWLLAGLIVKAARGEPRAFTSRPPLSGSGSCDTTAPPAPPKHPAPK